MLVLHKKVSETFLNWKSNRKHNSHVSKSVSIRVGGWTNSGWFVCPGRVPLTSIVSYRSQSLGVRVGIVEVSVGSRRENSILPLSFLMLETCTFLHGNATKCAWKPVRPVRFLDQRNFFIGTQVPTTHIYL